MEIGCRVYRPRDPRKTPLFHLLESLYESVKLAWEERFEARYGFWQVSWDDAVAHYLDCGIWDSGYVVTQSYYHCTTPTPSQVRITRRHHPLQGLALEVLHTGPRELVVRAPDGFSMRLPRVWTDADGAAAAGSAPDAVFSVDAIRALLEIVEALHRRGSLTREAGLGHVKVSKE